MSARKGLKPHALSTSASTLRAIVLVMALVALWPTAASAGTIGVPLSDATLKILNPGGGTASDSALLATGPDFFFDAFSGPFFAPPRCVANCAPGSSFIASTSVSFANGGGVIYMGVSQPVQDFPMGGSAAASWTVTAASIGLPPLGAPFTVIEPFLLDLTVSLADCPTCLTRNTRIDAGGAGNATLSFAPAGSSWDLTSADYTVTIPINPVPEPSMWLLVPTAVGLAWLARMKRKTTQIMPCRPMS